MTTLPLLRPMLAVTATPFDSEEYIYEVKWDGYRGLAYLSEKTVLRSRNLFDLSSKFPELSNLQEAVSDLPSLLDGEIIVMDKGIPSFSLLQERAKINDPVKIRQAAAAHPAVFIVFDVLFANGKTVMDQPLRVRKEFLKTLVKPAKNLIISEYILHRGKDFYQACVARGLEGAVAKNLNGPYLPGRRSSYWKKFRNVKEADLVICGYQYGLGRRKLKSLILGGYQNGKLIYQGKVGTGFNEKEADQIINELEKLMVAKPLFCLPQKEKKKSQWVRPILVCMVNYLALTRDGILRQPSFRHIRWDKSPDECKALN